MPTLTEQYRAQTLAIRAQTIRDVIRLWPALDFTNLEATLGALSPALAAIVRRDRQQVIGVASAYIKAERAAQDAPGSAVVVPAATIVLEQFASSLLTNTLAGYPTALRTHRPADAEKITLVKTVGGLGRLVLNGGRDTITESLRADPEGTGWYRVTSPDACDFCRLLEGRGAVYSAETARFAAHDHCACSVRPVYGDIELDVLPYEPSRHRDRSTAKRRARNSAAARAWIDEHL